MSEEFCEIELNYKPKKENYDEALRIFGQKFVENNKDKCKIKYKGKEYELNEYFVKIENNHNNKDLVNIKLKIIKNITNVSYMFFECSSLISLSDISNWTTLKVNDISAMFCGCKSLLSLPDISKWDISNIKDMSCLFGGCNSLKSLPDISKWNTSNVIDMSGVIFFGNANHYYRCQIYQIGILLMLII